MCLICERINMIKDGTNPYFVKELETGYVVRWTTLKNGILYMFSNGALTD